VSPREFKPGDRVRLVLREAPAVEHVATITLDAAAPTPEWAALAGAGWVEITTDDEASE